MIYEYIFVYIVLPLIIIIKIIYFFFEKFFPYFFHVYLNILDTVVSSLYANFGTPVCVRLSWRRNVSIKQKMYMLFLLKKIQQQQIT
jgi:hypothetical protein